jgi:hypothetical protein
VVIIKILKEFARATFSSGIVLLDENFIILEKRASTEKNLKIIKNSTEQILNKWANVAASAGDKEPRIQIEIEVGRACLQKFSFGSEESLFIIVYSRNISTEKLVIQKLPELARHIYEVRVGYASDER